MTSAPTPSLRRLAGALLALAVVPALAFAAAQVFVQSEGEAELARLRDEQLDGLLFSVNQNAWDVASAWAERLTWAGAGGWTLDDDDARQFFNTALAVSAVYVADTSRAQTTAYARDPGPIVSPTDARAAADRIARAGMAFAQANLGAGGARALVEQQAAGYRKLEPVPLGDRLGLVFVVGDAGGPPRLICLAVDPAPFVRDVVMPKLREVGLGGVALGVFARGAPVASTGPMAQADVERERPLWLLPGYTVGARVGEGSAEGLMRRRLGQVLGLLGGVTLVLGAGAWFVWRGVRRELEVARLRDGFVSNVSHELRTPLSLIRLYAESLAAGRVPEGRRQRYYDTLVAETERLSRLVGNVLHFDRFERGAARLDAARLDAGALADEIAGRYRPVLERDGCTLVTDVARGLAVRADRDALSEALVNLLDNAVKYGGPGEVTLRAARADGAVLLQVSDRGPGVPAADRERVFEPFVRVQPPSADGLVHTAKGTGLGLALVRRIARAHGGTATVAARPGGGATVQITLPADHA